MTDMMPELLKDRRHAAWQIAVSRDAFTTGLQHRYRFRHLRTFPPGLRLW